MRRLRITPLRLASALAAASLVGAGVGYAATLNLTSEHLGAASQTLTKGTCNLGSSSATEAWVDQSAPTQSNGGSLVTQTQNNRNQYSFLRFGLSGCSVPSTGGADTATLSLQVTSASKTNHTISAFPVYSSWSASSLTWTSAQSLSVGSTATDTFSSSLGTKTLTVTSDVDAAIKSGTFWGWELVDTNGGGSNTTTIDSPSLSVSYEK